MKILHPPVLLGLTALLFLGGCATSGGERSGSDRNRLTQEEIRASNATDLYSVIDERRPRWLRQANRPASPFGMSTGEDVVVYFDRNRQGGPDTLRGINTTGVHSVEFLSGSEAQQRFGMNHRMGAIIVNFAPRG